MPPCATFCPTHRLKSSETMGKDYGETPVLYKTWIFNILFVVMGWEHCGRDQAEHPGLIVLVQLIMEVFVNL